MYHLTEFNVHRLFACLGIAALLAACQTPQNGYETLRADLERLEAALQTNTQTSLTRTRDQVTQELARLESALGALQTQVQQSCKESAATVCEYHPPAVVTEDDKIVVGQVEQVWVDAPGFVMSARVDTGAHSSSLHAEDIVEFERDGADWVRFVVTNDDESIKIERPIEKYVRVYQQSDPEGTRRAVVNMRISLGNIQETFAFTLADRSHLEHGMILGRNFLTDLALVDVAREFVQPMPQAASR